MMSTCTNGLHLISLGKSLRKEGPVTSMEEQVDNNLIGEERSALLFHSERGQ